MDFITLQDVALADLNVDGVSFPLEKYKTLIGILTIFNDKDTKKLVARIVNDYTRDKLFDNKTDIPLKNNYEILGAGSYGIVFGSSQSEYCVKFNFMKNTGDREMILPKKLIDSNPNIEELIVVPTTYMSIAYRGLVYYFSLYYSLYVILLHSVYDRELNTTKFLKNLKDLKMDWTLTNLQLSTQHKYLFYSILNKYVRFQHIDFFDHIELMCGVLKPGGSVQGSLLVMKRAYLSSEMLKIDAYGRFNINGYSPYSEENTKMFRVLTLHVFLFILHANKNMRFIHKDLKPNNILVYQSNPYYLEYEDMKYMIPHDYRLRINDFGISTVVGKDKPSGVARDAHFFVHSLLHFFKESYHHDIYFFQALYNVFIAPLCNANFQHLNRRSACSLQCNKGHLPSNLTYNVNEDTLKNFLKLHFFDIYKAKPSNKNKQ